jgi:catechol 2,3-dioxygenase-like lactoylglutathione lyase family enzyme
LRHQLLDLTAVAGARPAKAKKAVAAAAKPRALATAPAPRAPAAARSASLVAVPHVDRLHQVAMTATNLDQSVAFYRDMLGLKFIARFDPPGLAFFNLGGGTRLLLSATHSSATLYFLVDDLKSAYADFQKRGIHFFQPPAMVHRDDAGQFGKKGNEEWMAFFRDPGGNTLALVEKRA